MPASQVRRFTDPDEYTAGVRAMRLEVAVTQPGRFAAKLTRIDLHRMWMQEYSESLPRIAHFDLAPGRAIFSLPTRAGPNILWSGKEQKPDWLMRHTEGEASFQRTTGSSISSSVSLPIEDMEALGATGRGCDFRPPKEPLAVVASSAAMKRLQSLHSATVLLAENAPEVIACPEAARGLEQALIHAMADCLGSKDDRSSEFRSRHHGAIMRRFYAMLEGNSDRVLYLPEMCKAVGVSNRTLTTCCHEALGMSPHRYLRLRQLHLARRALVLGDAALTTVTEVATAYGFWELGRFAVAYRTLFGERPSITLGRPANAAPIPFAYMYSPASSEFA
jgi:AraC-like DNA-binding protein